MIRFRSLSARLIVWIVATAVITIATFVVLVLLRADRGLSEQTAQLSRLSEEKLADRLSGDARLARSLVLTMLDDVSRRFATVAQRADIVRAVISANTVAISEILRPALVSSDVDGVVVVDSTLRVIGAHDLGVDVLKASKHIGNGSLAGPIGNVISKNDREIRRGFRLRTRFDALTSASVGTSSQEGLAEIMIEPVFDDFGDVIAVLVGHRLIKPNERTLLEFFSLTGRSIAILDHGRWLSGAGIRPPAVALLGLRTGNAEGAGQYVSQCVELWDDALTCAVASDSELKQLTEQLVEIGGSQARSLTLWLLLLAAASVVAFVVTCLLISRQITSPLVQITRAVSAGAKGEWTVEISGTRRNDEVGDIARAVEIFKANAIELLSNKAEMERMHLQLDAALNNMTHGLCMFDADARLIVCNEPFAQMYDLPPALTRRGTNLQAILKHGSAGARPSKVERAGNGAAPADTGVDVSVHELPDGRAISVSQQPMPDGGWVAVHEDITERRRAEAEITRLARTDILTGLPNRMVFREAIDQGLALCQTRRPTVIYYLDLDHFKTVNDTLGHPMGDALLKAVAQRLSDYANEGDVVSRLGGDEFAVVQVETGSEERIGTTAAEIVELLSEPYQVQGHEIVLGTSIGIAIAPRDGEDPDLLLKRADMALYKAKAEGRGTFRFFSAEMESDLQARRALESDLRNAFANEEFTLVYQPIVSLRTNQVCAFETLLRWHHPERGHIPPDKFIPLAEESGLIVPLTEWILRTACSEACGWPEHIRVAVNLSPVQFRRRHPLLPIINALAASGLPPNRLEIELTESLFIEAEKSTVDALHQLRSFGARIAMDDFGTGYSALSYLRSFPFDKIKIDRSFINGLGQQDAEAIVELIVKLGAKLNMSTVAEGVETPAQLERLRHLGCSEAQGYLFSRPVPANQVPQVISDCRAPQSQAA